MNPPQPWIARGNVLMGLLALLVASLGVAWVLWPPVEPRATDGLAAALLLAGGIGLILWRGPFPPWAAGVCADVIALIVLVLVWNRASAQGQGAFAMILIAVVALLGTLIPPRQMIGHLVAFTAGFLLVSLSEPWFASPLLSVQVIVVMWLVGMLLSVTATRLANARVELATQARNDPLTGVLNRRGLEEEAHFLSALRDREGVPVTVAVIDLDGFKDYNDRHGHAAADDILVQLTAGWRRNLRSGDLLSRTGGDEFVLVLGDADESGADHAVRQLREDSPMPFSVGIARWAPDQTLWQCIAEADRLMYADKARKRAPEIEHRM